MLHDWLFYALGWATTLLIGIGKGAFGGGLAILGIPLLAQVVDPLTGAIIIAMLVALMDIFALQSFGRATWSKPDLVWLLPGLVAGIAFGYAVFLLVDSRLVSLVIGLVTLAFALHWFVKGRGAAAGEKPVSPPLALLAATTSGFTTFVAHAGGPPVQMYLLRRGLPKTMLVGTNIALFTLGNWLKLPPYLSLGLARPEVLWGALALAPAAPLGVWIGSWLHRRLDQQRLFFWCYCLLTLAAAKLVLDAGRALLG